MFLPIDGKVWCDDCEVGHTTCVIVEPATQHITDIVVLLAADQTQRLVPVEWIQQTTPDSVYLNCSQAALDAQPRFALRKVICVPNIHYSEQDSPARTLFTFYAAHNVEENVPEGELAIHVGAKIHAADGRLGTISEFIVDENDQITHVVLDESHWYGTLHSLIPIDAVDYIDEDRLVLKLTRDDVAHLPHRRSIRALQSDP